MRFDAFFRAFYIGESDGHLKGYTTTWAIPKFFAESILRDEKSREKLPQDDMSYDKWFQGNASPRNHWANFAKNYKEDLLVSDLMDTLDDKNISKLLVAFSVDDGEEVNKLLLCTAIKDGGYATSSTYVDNLCSIIEKYSLTQYDAAATETKTVWYRVRKTWADSKSQLGAYKVLANAKACADKNPGYYVFDPDGKAIYPEKTDTPFLVRVSISDLNIRRGPGTNYSTIGRYTGIGVFTILEVRSGQGSTAGWGRLKSGIGWISLDFTTRL